MNNYKIVPNNDNEKNTTNNLTLSNTNTSLPTSIGRQRRQILSEEEYTSTLNKIITRDYYPSLPSLNRDAAVLQKRADGDIKGAIAIRRAARQLESYEEQCMIQETKEEQDAILHHGGVRKRPRPLDRESLDDFHARVTSEDNAEFEYNMNKEVKERKERMDRIYNTGDLAAAAAADSRKRIQESPFQSASDQFDPPVQRIEAPGTTKDGQNLSNRNSLFFTPQHIPAEDIHINKSTIKATNTATEPYQAIIPLPRAIETNQKSTQDHYLSYEEMPPPPPPQLQLQSSTTSSTLVKSNNQTSSQQSQKHIYHLVEYKAKNKLYQQSSSLLSSSNVESSLQISSNHYNNNEKKIIPENTRFEYQNKSNIVPSSSSSLASSLTTNIATNQQQLHQRQLQIYDTDSSMNTDLDSSPKPLHIERQARIHQLQKERNTLVAMTPTIIPGGSHSKRLRYKHKKGGSDDNNDGDNDDDDDNDEDDDDENDSPIITWGTIKSTPLVSGGEKPSYISDMSMIHHGPQISGDGMNEEKVFTLPTTDDREKVAKKVEAKLARQKQRYQEASSAIASSTTRSSSVIQKDRTCGKSNKSASLSSPSFINRKESLTPAARSLLERSTKRNSSSIRSSSSVARNNSSLRISSSSSKGIYSTSMPAKVCARSNSALGSALRASYTPKRIQDKISNRQNLKNKSKDMTFKSTPLAVHVPRGSSSGTSDKGLSNIQESNNSSEKTNRSLTSGLLKL